MARPIVFLSDYGLKDEFVGVCHGVLACVAPDARVIDLTHSIPPHDVSRGAVVLARSLPYMPKDAVYLAVVDPGVGTERRGIAVTTPSGAALVGPDNGLLSLGWEELGGVWEAVELLTPGSAQNEPHFEPSSEGTVRPATFDGRDVFAPAAARVATRTDVTALGTPIDPATLIRLERMRPEVGPHRLDCHVLGIDRFGNVELDATQEHLREAQLQDARSLVVTVGGEAARCRRSRTFADLDEGELGAILNSWGSLEIVLDRASAAVSLGVARGDRVVIASMPD